MAHLGCKNRLKQKVLNLHVVNSKKDYFYYRKDVFSNYYFSSACKFTKKETSSFGYDVC